MNGARRADRYMIEGAGLLDESLWKGCDMSNQTESNSLLALLGIEKPIIQAPMAGVSTPALAAAVSNAGGLGSLGVGAMNAERARKVIRDTRALTDKPFNINVFCHSPRIAGCSRRA